MLRLLLVQIQRSMERTAFAWLAFWTAVLILLVDTGGSADVLRRLAGRLANMPDHNLGHLALWAGAGFGVLWLWDFTVELTDKLLPCWPWQRSEP